MSKVETDKAAIKAAKKAQKEEKKKRKHNDSIGMFVIIR